MKKVALLLLAVSALAIYSCDVSDTQDIDRTEFALTWQENFDGAAGTLPDSTRWNFDLGNGVNGWGNAELQSYTNDTTNIKLDGNGNLLITATNPAEFQFRSARINTRGKFSQQYGRFEARIKTPYGPGIWPAFWMLGEDDELIWPQIGEIDIMELRGQQPSIMSSALHGPGYNGNVGGPILKAFALEEGRFDAEFHLFAVEWFPNRIDFYVDDFLYHRVTPDDVEDKGEWVFNERPFYIILNVAVGGGFVGFPLPSTPFPQTMTVDYVRVYEEAN